MRFPEISGDIGRRRGRPPNALGHISLPITAKLHSTCMPTRRLDIFDIFQLGLFRPDRAPPHHRTELGQTDSGSSGSDTCYQLNYDGHTFLFVTAELFSHYMPTRSDTLLHILTDALKQADMDRLFCRTTEQQGEWSTEYITKFVDVSSPLSLQQQQPNAPHDANKARIHNTHTQQIKGSNQQIQVIFNSNTRTVKYIACTSLILFAALSVFCAQLLIVILILCDMLKQRMLSALFSVLIFNILNNMIASKLLLHKSQPGNRKTVGSPKKSLYEAESNPPPTTWAGFDTGLPRAHDINRNYYSTIPNCSLIITSDVTANTFSIPPTDDLLSISSYNYWQKVYPLLPTCVAIDQGEGNGNGGDKKSSESAPPSENSQSQAQGQRISGRPTIRQGNTTRYGNDGEDDDEDDDLINNGKKSKSLSRCEASVTLNFKSNTNSDIPVDRNLEDASGTGATEPETSIGADETQVEHTIGFTSRVWAAAKSFLTYDSTATTGYANSTEIAPTNVSANGILQRKELSSVSPIHEHTSGPFIIVTPAHNLNDARLDLDTTTAGTPTSEKLDGKQGDMYFTGTANPLITPVRRNTQNNNFLNISGLTAKHSKRLRSRSECSSPYAVPPKNKIRDRAKAKLTSQDHDSNVTPLSANSKRRRVVSESSTQSHEFTLGNKFHCMRITDDGYHNCGSSSNLLNIHKQSNFLNLNNTCMLSQRLWKICQYTTQGGTHLQHQPSTPSSSPP